MQLNDLVKLLALKRGHGESEGESQSLLVGSCCRQEFDVLLKSFVSRASLRHSQQLCTSLLAR